MAELKVEIRAYEKGYVVSKPSCESRYDLVIDIDNKLLRVQVKYLDVISKDGCALELDLRKETRNNGIKRAYSSDEIDIVAVYVPCKNIVMWLPPALFNNRQSICFRIKPLKRNVKGSRFVEDFVW